MCLDLQPTSHNSKLSLLLPISPISLDSSTFPAVYVNMSTSKAPSKSNYDRSKSAKSAMSDKTVYSLPDRDSKDIVDLVLKIMDEDGPRPMKNLRPVQKQRNGADQFYEDHHGEYEARGQLSRDKIGRVHTHNNAYPKMYDELHKRRATAQPESYIENDRLQTSTYLDPNCPICIKLKRQMEFRNKSIRKKSRHRPKSNHRDTRTTIAKPKRPQRRYKTPSKVFTLARIWTNKGCQCTSYAVPAETRSACTFNDVDFLSAASPQQTQDGAFPTTSTNEEMNEQSIVETDMNSIKSPTGGKKASKTNSAIPGTSPPSVSSYNSFMSMEHEPMVE